MDSNGAMVDMLKRRGFVRTPRVEGAFRAVDRAVFVPVPHATDAYEDTPLSIGEGQTISAPSMVAIMLEAADLAPGQRVLEVGTGSGYNACLLAAATGGTVVTIERIPALYKRAEDVVHRLFPSVHMVLGDGTLGEPARAPYDRILVTAAAPAFPSPLIDQLAPRGKILAPVGSPGEAQVLMVGTKLPDGSLQTVRDVWCRFVPLIGRHGFPGGEEGA